MALKTLCAVVIGALVCNSAFAQIHDPKALSSDPATSEGPIAPVLQGLGSHEMPISTTVAQSQDFFNQGLRLTYGFNHSEAMRAFKEAARLDPDNAMAYWGWALVLGPNLNLPMVADVVPQAYDAVQRAMARRDGASAKERALIEALAARYSEDPKADRAALDQAYASAMAEVVKAYPRDLDAATLYAASLMNLSPWDYWYPDGTAKPGTNLLLSTLESVIARNEVHPGALHYYIHAVEAVHPARGESAADRLANLMPGAGHMVHMPSHIYMRLGRYADSYQANYLASEADERYIAQCNAQGIYPLGYYPHNVHFLAWSAMFQGRKKATMAAARRVASKIPEDLDSNTWALFETFLAQPLYGMVRFGMWDDIRGEPAPPEEARFMTGVWHYARGLAEVHDGSSRVARRELKALQKLRKSIIDEEYYIGFGAAGNLLGIAENILVAEISAKRKRFEDAVSKLDQAVRLEDGLLYNEPPDWYFPVRHILGAVLLDAGRPAEAEVVYWEDLEKNPNNGFALFGLRQALIAQGKDELAAVVGERYDRAFNQSDVVLTSSRF